MPQTSSQPELDARFAVFLNPIRDLTKNWEVDISKYLEEYLEELAEIRISFDGGETLMNFAEAAMLIQGSAAVYCKKVEFLWQMVLQMLDLLSSKKSIDSKDTVKGDNKQKACANTSAEFDNLELKEGKNINIKDEENDEDIAKSIKFLPKIPLHLFEKENGKPVTRIPLQLKNHETFGNKEDFLISRSYLSLTGVLCLDIPKELLWARANNQVDMNNCSTAGFLSQSPAKNMEPIEESPRPVSPLVDDLMEPDVPEEIDEPPQSPVPEPNPLLECISPVTTNRTGLRARKTEAVVNKEVPLIDPWKPMDPHLESPSKRPIRAGRIRKPLPCSCHKERPKKSKRQRTSKSTLPSGSEGKKSIVPIDTYISQQLTNLITNNNTKLSSDVTESCLVEELAKERKKRGNMKPMVRNIEEENKLKDNPVTEDEEPGIDMDNMDMDMPDPHGDDDIPYTVTNAPKGLNNTLNYEPGSDYEALVQKWVSDYVSNAQEHVASSELTKRVNNWKKIIMPALEVEEKRQNFDIHSYGSHVLSYFPKGNSKDTFLFEDLVQNDNQKEVCRMFLSCLMLANTSNVELRNTKEGDLEMDCLELKLLSRQRHHKQLEEYAAPSQIISPKRTIKDKRKNHQNVSGDDTSNSPKTKKKTCR